MLGMEHLCFLAGKRKTEIVAKKADRGFHVGGGHQPDGGGGRWCRPPMRRKHAKTKELDPVVGDPPMHGTIVRSTRPSYEYRAPLLYV